MWANTLELIIMIYKSYFWTASIFVLRYFHVIPETLTLGFQGNSKVIPLMQRQMTGNITFCIFLPSEEQEHGWRPELRQAKAI